MGGWVCWGWCSRCLEALRRELRHAHELVLRTLVALCPDAKCRHIAQELRAQALVHRLAYPLYRKQEDLRYRDKHATMLREIAIRQQRPVFKRVSG